MKKGFVAYSKADAAAVERLIIHLRGLQHEGVIATWHDRQLIPGQEWDAGIRMELAGADIVILCVSADFLATEYIQRVEIPAALRRHQDGEAVVIPVIFGKCDWQGHPISRLQSIPAKGRTVRDYIRQDNLDEVWAEVTASVRHAVEGSPNELDSSRAVATAAVQPRSAAPRRGAEPVVFSNLRPATDLERDDFTRSTFAGILDYFSASLKRLEAANPNCETRLRHVAEDAFEASAYVGGRHLAHCGVFIQSEFGRHIGYCDDGVGDRRRTNENLSLEGERRQELKWRAWMSAMRTELGTDTDAMDVDGTATYLWSIFESQLLRALGR